MSTTKGKPNYTDLTHQIVRDSETPLTFDEIVRRVSALTPVTTKNPKSTIRNAVSQSRLIAATGDRRYGWMPRLLTGSVLRLTLSDSDLQLKTISLGDELRDALWPTFFENQKRSDRSPIHLQLPNDQVTEFPLEGLGVGSGWGSTASPKFWSWFKTLKAKPRDHLIFRVLDGMGKLYGVKFQRHAERDEAAITARNDAVVQAALKFLRSRINGAAIWDICAHLLASGQYRHPVPPDPLAEIWTREVWGPVLDEKGYYGGWILAGTGREHETLLAEALETSILPDYDVDHPRDLPREYQAGSSRRPRASRLAAKGPVKTFTLRVNHRALPKVWRDIEIAEDQTLEDLHLAIQRAYEWDDDHLYTFFMSGREWDQGSEIGSPWSETRRHTHQVEMGNLDLKPGMKFLYLFDYGDSHEFDVQILTANPSASKGSYPKVVGQKGKAPPQYPDYDEETGEPEWDPYRR